MSVTSPLARLALCTILVLCGFVSPPPARATTSPPPAPAGLVLTPGNAEISLGWSASAGATSYQVWRGLQPFVAGTLIAQPASPSYHDTALKNGSKYYYVLAAVGPGGVSTYSAQLSATPLAAIPSAPTDLNAKAGNLRIGLAWNPSDGATSYQVWRATSSKGSYARIAAPTTTSYTDTLVANGSTYYYQVAAADGAGVSNFSDVASATAVALTPPVPTDVVGKAGNTEVTLTWAASAGASEYHVWRATTSGGPYVLAATPTSDGYTETGLTNGTAYYFVVTAANTAGVSAYSEQVSVKPAAGQTGGAPPAPAALSATAGNAQAALSWSASTGATQYHLWRGTTSGGPYTVVGAPTATTYTDTGLSNGTVYYYVVTAVDSAGTSANSAQVSAKPAATVGASGVSWVYYSGTLYWPGDWSWSGVANYKDTAGIPEEGPYDASFTLTGQWGGWLPYAPGLSFPTAGYQSLTIDLKPTVANQVWLANGYTTSASGGDQETCATNIMQYAQGAVVVGKWTTFVIPLSAICAVNIPMRKFAIQDGTGLGVNTWYIDNVGFVPTPK